MVSETADCMLRPEYICGKLGLMEKKTELSRCKEKLLNSEFTVEIVGEHLLCAIRTPRRHPKGKCRNY